MDRTVFLLTVALAVATIVFYGFRCWKTSEAMNVSTLVNIILHAAGIIAGVFLVLSTIFPEYKETLSSLDIYIFIAGVAVCSVSVQGMMRDLPSAATKPLPALQPAPEVQPMIAAVVATAGVGQDLTR